MSDAALLFGYFVISFTISRQYYRYQEACLKQKIDKLGQELEYQLSQLGQEIDELREKENGLDNLDAYKQQVKKEMEKQMDKIDKIDKMDKITKSKTEDIENQITILKQGHTRIENSLKALTSHVSLVNNILENDAISSHPGQEKEKDKSSTTRTSWFGFS